jgi:hypothetical protein
VDKGLTRGTILEGYDDLIISRIRELGLALGEAVYVARRLSPYFCRQWRSLQALLNQA